MTLQFERSDQRHRELKDLDQQVIVVTGATSGIGLATARMAAERGARLVLAARSEDALEDLVEEIEAEGGEAVSVVADVSDRDDVQEIARVAEEEFGGFDTWVNVAAAFIYGRLDDVPLEEMQQQFETNVWGLLYGSMEAADHLEDRGGAIINLGSVVSDRSIPLQGSYSASKHAVKGFTDALRMELEEDGAPVSVTLVKPAAIDTPYPDHAKNYMEEPPSLPPPVYAPETVARAILDAAERPQREVIVGGGGKFMTAFEAIAPRLFDFVMESSYFDLQQRDEPAPEENVLDEPVGSLDERGGYQGHVSESSLYTRVSQGRALPGGRALRTLGLVTVLYLIYRYLLR